MPFRFLSYLGSFGFSYAVFSYYFHQKNTRPFDTQSTLIAHQKNTQAAFCLPLTHLWLMAKLTHTEASFLNDEEKTRQLLASMLIILNQKIDRHEDFIHHPFIEKNIPFQEKTTSISDMASQFSKSDTMLVRFPTAGGGYHAMGFFREGSTDKCEMFDADYPRGEKKGHCPEIEAFMISRMKTYGDENRPVYLAFKKT